MEIKVIMIKDKRVSLLHPFSAKAIGLCEQDVFHSHSKPHEKALLKLQEDGCKVSIAYFTGNFFPFTKEVNGITKRFWPITKPLLKKRHGWRKQHSLLHYWNTKYNPPDVTIINMSGHGSSYCFKLATLLVKKQKPYLVMVGGIHISEDVRTVAYYQNAHHIIVHTQVQRKQLLQKAGFKNLNIQVMPLGIDTALFIPLEKNTPIINLLFVGRISRLKQIELSLEVLAHLLKNQNKNVTLTIVGPISDEGYFLELKTLAKQLQVANHVTFTGSIKQKELVPFYQKATLLMLPSAHESFGMVMVEAMACGTPVAALKDSGGPDELIEHAYNGLLTTKEMYAQNILDFAKSREMQSRLSANARDMVEQKWSLRKTEEALKASIEQVFVTL